MQAQFLSLQDSDKEDPILLGKEGKSQERRVKRRKKPYLLIGHPISVHGQDPVCGSAFFSNYMIVGEIA